MDKKTTMGIVIAAIIILLGVGVYALTRPSGTDNTATEPPTTSTSPSDDTTQTPATETSEMAQMTTIAYADEGFSPVTLTVKKGTKIMVVNNSSMNLSFASADHPTHTKQPELNMESTLKPGESGSITITKTGTWGYHNHVAAEHFGQVVVTE